MDNDDIKRLALSDLERSGLTKSDFNKMQLTACSEEEAEIILNSQFSTCGYVIPYFDTKGKLQEDFRFRFLDDLKDKKDKLVKYSQPKGSKPRLYFAPNIKWSKLLKDTKVTIVFTEGEKKAYKACAVGIPTIGLSGVWSFKSKKQQKKLIDDFSLITLADRKILICFDNDIQSNEDVLKASRCLAKELNNSGAVVSSKLLPFNPYQKIGLDDFLLSNSKDDFDNLKEEEFSELVELDELNCEMAYIKEVGKIYLINDKLFVGDKPLVNLIYANRTMLTENGPVSVAGRWLSWPNRRTHTRLTYKPGQPIVTGANEFNLWRGWGCEPKKGNIKTFLDAVKKIFNHDAEIIKWFMNWVAYPIQNPGAKMLSAVLLQSIETGTGKSSIGLCIGAMYGDNYKLVDDAQLSGSFNEWAINKQFVLGDEVSGKDKRGEADKLKNLITRPEVTINKKYSPSYTVPDCINYLFTSNHPDPLSIEPEDRRIFVYEIMKGHGISLQQGKQLRVFREGQGTAYLLHYFINEYVISKGFDHEERPPMTAAKMELINHSLTDVERFLVNLKENAEFALAINGVTIDRDLFTTSQIVHLYERINPKLTTTSTAVGKALKKIFNESQAIQVRTLNGVQSLRPLRNFDKWAKASHKEMQEHYDRSKIALFGVKKRKFKSKEKKQ